MTAKILFLCSVKAFVACSFYCLCCNCLCNRFFITVYGIVCRANFTQKRLGDGYGFKLVAVACNRFAQLIIFCAVHQMSRLNLSFFIGFSFVGFRVLFGRVFPGRGIRPL